MAGEGNLFVKCKLCKGLNKFHNEVEKEIWKDEGFECKHCGERWSGQTPTERQLLLLQDEYIKDVTNNEIATQMVYILQPYIKSLLLKNFSNLIDSPEDLKYHCTNTIHFIMDQYIRDDKDFFIGRSFAGYAIHKIKESFFGYFEKGKQPKNEKGKYIPLESLNYILEDGNEAKFPSDKYNSEFIVDDMLNRNFLFEYLSELVFNSSDYMSIEDYQRVIYGLDLYLNYGDTKAKAFFKHYKRKSLPMFEKVMNMLEKEIIKRIEE